MKIGNVPSGEANFTLPTPHWVGPVSRRLRCCNKSSRRLLARARTAACFSGSQSLSAAVGSHPHMRWRAAVGQCLLWWGNPAGSKLPPHKHPFSAIACCDPASSPCEPGRRRALIILFYVFLFLFIAVQEDFHTTEFPSAVFSATVCLKERKRNAAFLFLGPLHSRGLSECSYLFRCLKFLNSPLDIGTVLFSSLQFRPSTETAYLALCL